ncbi:MAG: hypothetical protein HLUCCA11_23725 [Phormidesmis priestleyi Ana]|uniref:Uncharacterized protein n=1 Tax=Phormidesmis priestleyi Ana TaxID=1666911 RepID=A0A0P7Z9L9_9CYAN|nr:MAG: hypothetical protein HLUCCA11_23725 [Phormidesmis priestleyi Ana]
MPTKFIDTIGGKLAEQWIAALLTPAFCFWAGGITAWLLNNDASQLQQYLESLEAPLQLALLAAILLIITTSAFAVQQIESICLHFLEGYYWPQWVAPLGWLYRKLLKRQERRLQKLKVRWEVLSHQRHQQTVADVDDTKYETIRELYLLEYQRRWIPSQVEYLMPTVLGNILRAAERRPWHKYKLDSVVCWPCLWLLLPDNARKDVQEARESLNSSVRLWIWSILFVLVWAWWTWWAIPIGVTTALFAHQRILSSARSYGNLLEATFDLYRINLYKALRWSLPKTSEEEKKQGEILTEYLWRGSIRNITFQNDSPVIERNSRVE